MAEASLSSRYPSLSHVKAQRRFLRPRTHAAKLAPDPQDVVDDLVVVGYATRRWDGEDVAVLLLSHPAEPGIEFMARKVTAVREMASNDAMSAALDLMSPGQAAGGPAGGEAAVADDERGEEEERNLPPVSGEDLDAPLDDAEEDLDEEFTVQVEDTPLSAAGVQYEPWGEVRVNIAPERSKAKAKLAFSSHIQYYTAGVIFRRFFPEQTALKRIVAATNAAKTGLDLCEEEFWAYIALIMVGSNYACATKKLWRPHDEMNPRPPFGKYMSRRRFEEISGALRLTQTARPAFHDPFHAVRELIDDWNAYMKEIFTPSGTVCLDESMVVHNNDKVPGWMTVKRKPHPLGNEYHTICCGETAILFKVDLVEGKARPAGMGPVPNEASLGKTGALVLRMVDSLHGTGRVIVMDSAFCVMKAVKALYDHGLFAATVAKKRAHWPRGIPGDAVRDHMQGKPVGEMHTLKGSYEGMPLCLYAVNHTGYTFLLLATYGSSVLQGPERKVRAANGSLFTYRRNEPISDYYDVRHAVDDHNHLRQGQRVNLERAWGSKFWANRQLAFVISSTLVNACLAYNHFSGKTCLRLDEFKDRVALDLLHAWQAYRDELADAPTPPGKRASRQRRGEGEHVLQNIPPYTGPRGPSKKAYQQWKCKGKQCEKFVRMRCSCNDRLSLCTTCFASHLTETLQDE
jgi:hypothetical protein